MNERPKNLIFNSSDEISITDRAYIPIEVDRIDREWFLSEPLPIPNFRTIKLTDFVMRWHDISGTCQAYLDNVKLEDRFGLDISPRTGEMQVAFAETTSPSRFYSCPKYDFKPQQLDGITEAVQSLFKLFDPKKTEEKEKFIREHRDLTALHKYVNQEKLISVINKITPLSAIVIDGNSYKYEFRSIVH